MCSVLNQFVVSEAFVVYVTLQLTAIQLIRSILQKIIMFSRRSFVIMTYKPRHEKNIFLPVQKQRRISASSFLLHR